MMMYWLGTSYCVLYVQIALNEIHFLVDLLNFYLNCKPFLQILFMKVL